MDGIGRFFGLTSFFGLGLLVLAVSRPFPDLVRRIVAIDGTIAALVAFVIVGHTRTIPSWAAGNRAISAYAIAFQSPTVPGLFINACPSFANNATATVLFAAFALLLAAAFAFTDRAWVRLDREALAPAVSGAQLAAPPAQGGLRVTLRPIAGTRPRGKDADEDEALARELLADAKERAEHLMLVDLGRNDLGRVCAPGSVRVTESFALERYSRVMHIVSEVQGELRAGLTALDALRAAFPAGTLSGAPKIRALQIIDELEPAARGWYGGAVGYLGFDGAADFAICIRSLIATGDQLRVQAGAGLVFDSVPEAEDRECQAKASAVLRAIAMAQALRGAG